MHFGMSKSLFNRPLVKPLSQGGLGYSKYLSPLLQASCDSIKLNKPSRGFISCLLLACSPLTVTHLIIAIDIYAVKCIALWLIAHVSIEISKVAPSWIISNTTTSVVFVVTLLGIITPGFHPRPTMVGGGDVGIGGVMMLGASGKGCFIAKTAAGLGSSVDKAVAWAYGSFATIAFDEPSGLTLSGVFKSSYYSPAIKTLSSDVYDFHI